MKELLRGVKLHFRRRKNFNVKFDSIWLTNRWRRSYISRAGSWTILGFGIRNFSRDAFEYYFSFFGLDLRIFFNRKWKK